MGNFGKMIVLTAAFSLASQTITLAGASADAVYFILCEYNGKIALMEEGGEEPIAVYKTPISSLYPADAELLREGIRLKNRAELSRLIEDLDLE